MRKLKFYGSSDDNFIIEGELHADEIDCLPAYDQPATFRVEIPDTGVGLFVTGQYGIHEVGTWMIGISPLDEDVPFPEAWSLTWSFENYTTVLELECSNDAEVTTAKSRTR